MTETCSINSKRNNPMFLENVISPILTSFKNFEQKNAFCIDDEYYSYKTLMNKVSAIAIDLEGVVDVNIFSVKCNCYFYTNLIFFVTLINNMRSTILKIQYLSL